LSELKPLVSVLVPAYNSERWLREAIESALNQTWSRIEVIVVDDGSTDATLRVARSLECARVKVASQPNQGVSAARNRALSLSQGEFIQWLDADDILDPQKVAAQLRAAGFEGCSPRVLLSAEWGSFYSRPAKARFQRSELWSDLSAHEWLLRKLESNAFMADSAWLVSRALTDLAGPWDEQLWKDNDGEYFCRVVLAAEGIKFVSDAKVYYRRTGPGSVSHIGASRRKLESQARSIVLHVKYLRSFGDDARTRAACLAYVQRWLPEFYPEHPDLVEQLGNCAADVGGALQAPSLGWKHDWLRQFVGWKLARKIQRTTRNARQRAAIQLDSFADRLERLTAPRV
jgi:glycosyltransferase involved in cell wall biosynthesis